MIKEYDYDKFAKYYDVFDGLSANNENNDFLYNILKKYKIKTVSDMTCGTGLQSLFLHKKGFKVYASDYSKGMIAIANKKAKKEKIKLITHVGDIRNHKTPKADAVISMFNAIGHLSESDFAKALKNIYNNLNENGLYIFDIFNLDYMKNNFYDFKFIDNAQTIDDTYFVRFNDNKLDVKTGILKINQKTYIQKGISPYIMCPEVWDMKIYTLDRLKRILKENNFEILEVYGSNKKKFTVNSLSILVVARKI